MSAFDDALQFSMRWECSPKFDIRDPYKYDGYVNHKDDRGGETRFGVAKRSHPNLDIKNLS